jgi:hypothetical protein
VDRHRDSPSEDPKETGQQFRAHLTWALPVCTSLTPIGQPRRLGSGWVSHSETLSRGQSDF